MRKVGIRREDRDVWETRVPLIPRDVATLIKECDTTVVLQPSAQRVFADDAFASVGAVVCEDLSECELILAVKEIPETFFEAGKTYVFFSHTIKGQTYNMDMLRRMMDLGCQLIDYERIANESNQRLISFSRFAGLAGAIDTLWALGRRLEWEGLEPNPFAELGQTYTYPNLDDALAAVAACGERIARDGVPEALRPFVVGIAGYGRVSQGAQEVIRALEPVAVAAGDVEALAATHDDGRLVHEVVFREEHLVELNEPAAAAGGGFDLDDYYRHPERYRGSFARFLPSLSAIVNAIYWEERYPRLVTKADLRDLWSRDVRPRLTVIGDISCDIGGSVEFTLKDTHVDDPAYVYDPETDTIQDGFAGRGPVVLAVGNLPCELSRDASEAFSEVLCTFVPSLIGGDFNVPFAELSLPPELKRALILHHGELTPDYAYLRRFL